MVVALAVPNKEDMKYIIGGAIVLNTADAVSSVDAMKELPENLVTLANAFIKDSTEKLNESSKTDKEDTTE